VRGGSWINYDNALRSAVRYWFFPPDGDNDVGFRCARSS